MTEENRVLTVGACIHMQSHYPLPCHVSQMQNTLHVQGCMDMESCVTDVRTDMPFLFINPRRACAARVTAVVLSVCLSVCLSVRASSRTTGYEAANQWYQRVVNNEKMDCVPEIWRENKRKSLRERSIAHARMWVGTSDPWRTRVCGWSMVCRRACASARCHVVDPGTSAVFEFQC